MLTECLGLKIGMCVFEGLGWSYKDGDKHLLHVGVHHGGPYADLQQGLIMPLTQF